MKIVPFFPNSPDNEHCMQACVKSMLAFYLPKHTFTDQEINQKTGGEWTWTPQTVLWLDILGLDVKLYSPFDYKKFSIQGDTFLKNFKGKARYDQEKATGQYDNLPEIQKASLAIVNKGLFINKNLENSELAKMLKDENTLAIGKTIHELLSGNDISGTSHYIVVIKEYSRDVWKIHDPGLPPFPNRKVNASINNHGLFGDIIVITGIK